MKKYLAWQLVYSFAALLTTAGCIHYQLKLLTPETVKDALTIPTMGVLRVKAQSIKHPILHSIEFDERDGLSPDEAAVLAVLVNPSLRSIRDQRGIADAQLLQAGLLPNPIISLGWKIPVGSPKGVTAVTARGFGLSWNITSLITRRARMQAASAQIASIDLDIAWQEWQVAQSAKATVYSVIALESQWARASETERELRDQLSLIKTAVEQHYKVATDLAAAEAARQTAQTTALALERDLAQQKLVLKRLLGLSETTEIPLQQGANLPSKLNLPSTQELLDGLEDQRLDLIALRRGYDSQQSTVRAEILARFPKTSLGANYESDTGKIKTVGPSVDVDLPIFDRNQGAIALATATCKKLFDEYVSRVFEARSEIERLRTLTESLTQQITAAEEVLPVLERLTSNYKNAVAVGNADILLYYTTRNDLNNKNIEVLKLKHELIAAKIDLESASGQFIPDRDSCSEPARMPRTTPKFQLPLKQGG